MRTKKFYVVVMLVMLCRAGFGQVQSGDVNGEIRELLSKLNFPLNHNPFFYDFVEHCTDEKWMVAINDFDTNNFANWYTIYDEMKYSAHDTSILPNTLIMLRKAESISRLNEVPIGLLSVDMDMFKTDVFTNQGDYFNWDDDYVYDVANRPNTPYEFKGVFIGSVLNHNSYFRDVKFRICPDLIFHDSKYRFLNGSVTLEKLFIDFGDGNGWIPFDDKVNQTYDVSYSSAGTFEIKFGYFICDPYPNCSSDPIRVSKSFITVLNDIPLEAPNATYDDIPGITYGIYDACNPNIKKKIIFLEGFDMYNTKGIPQSYTEFFNDESIYLKSLRAFDYNIVIVNWNNSTYDLRENATSIVRLLEKFKLELNEGENEQFVIVGNSMGGIIGRLVLNYMESKDYQDGKPIEYIPEGERELISPLYIKPSLMHNTRLLVTFDAGYEGVYIPVSIQHVIKKLKEINTTFSALAARSFFPITLMVAKAQQTNQVLESMALKQLLIYHVNNYKFQRGSISYRKMIEKYNFDNLVFNYKPQNNGMSEYCKVMTFTSGLLSGERQTDWFGKELIPGYNMANVEFNLKKRIFRLIERQVFNLKFSLNALPDYKKVGNVFNYTATYNKFKLRGCFRKLISGKGDCINTDVVDKESASAELTKPYEVISGGNVNAFKLLTDGQFNSDENDFFIFAYKYKYDPSAQSLSADFSLGLLTPRYISFSLSSDALIFNFIPVYSALGIYPKNNIVELDLYHTPNSDIFKSTGSDLISGFCKSPTFPNNENGIHSYIENKKLVLGINVPKNHNRIIQREIGDDVIFLNNFKLNRNAQITINDSVYLGNMNPEYEYIQSDYTKNVNQYFLSRNESLEIIAGGKLTIVSNNGSIINPQNCVNCKMDENVINVSSNLIVCTNFLRANKSNIIADKSNEIHLYPVPTISILNIISKGNGISRVVVKDYLMNIIIDKALSISSNVFELDFRSLPAGIYLVEIEIEIGKVSYHKIIVTK